MKIHDALLKLGFKFKPSMSSCMNYYIRHNITVTVLEDGEYFTIWATIRKTTRYNVQFREAGVHDFYTPVVIGLLSDFIKRNSKAKLPKTGVLKGD